MAIFLKEVLGLDLSRGAVNKFKESAAAFYEGTYENLIKKIASGRLVHADETRVNLKAGVGYVWAFTNLEDVVYVYAASREGDLVHSLLKDFKGVLVSDFYAAYDSMNCPQQKCLIHLIRDLNEDLMKEPFNEEMKGLVSEFAMLLQGDHFDSGPLWLESALPACAQASCGSLFQAPRSSRVSDRNSTEVQNALGKEPLRPFHLSGF